MNEKITPLPWKAIEGEFGLMIENSDGWDEALDADYSYIVESANAYPALTARVKELEEALDLVTSLASREWQEADGSRKAAKDNSGKLLWFVSDDVMRDAKAALNKEPTT